MESFSGGIDMFTRATLLQPNQYQNGYNILIRDNFEARTRAGADPLGGTVIDGSTLPLRGLRYYDTPATSQLLAVTNSKLYKWEGANWNTISGYTPASNTVGVEIEQGIDKAMITDGVGHSFSYDGTSVIDLGATASDPPVGISILTWHTNRMFAAGHPTLTDTVWVSNFLNFGTGQWDSTLRSFRIGSGDGDPIVGMFPITGVSGNQFTLAIMKRNSVWITNTDPTQPPANWSTNQGVAKLSGGIGLCGKHAAAAYGDDLYFVSRDNQIYSLQRMISAAGQNEVSPPISQPIQPLIDRINTNALSGIEAIKYKELILFAVPLDASTYNNALLVYNARLKVWMGYWDGWTPSTFEITRFNGIPRLVFGDNAGHVNQWKDYLDVKTDTTYLDNGAGYPSQMDTRSTQFGELLNRKSGRNMKARFTAGNSLVTISAYTDLANARSQTTQIAPSGDLLGVGKLGTFRLATTTPATITRGLRNLARFNELFVRIRSETGWWFLRSCNMAAYLCSFNDKK